MVVTKNIFFRGNGFFEKRENVSGNKSQCKVGMQMRTLHRMQDNAKEREYLGPGDTSVLKKRLVMGVRCFLFLS